MVQMDKAASAVTAAQAAYDRVCADRDATVATAVLDAYVVEEVCLPVGVLGVVDGRVGRDGCCCCTGSFMRCCVRSSATSTLVLLRVHPQAALVLALSRIQLAAPGQGAAGPTVAGSKRCVQCRLWVSWPTSLPEPTIQLATA